MGTCRHCANWSERLSETGWSWGDGPGVGVPASAGVWPQPADAGTPGARSGGAGHPACRGTDANHLFRQSLKRRSYMVGPKPGICLDKQPHSPPAGRNGIVFFTIQCCTMYNIVMKKTKKYHAAAGRLLGRSTDQNTAAPRNSCETRAATSLIRVQH